jgi:hypothetical protein
MPVSGLLLQMACVCAYIASLALPALVFNRPFPPTQSGLDVLATGAFGLIVLDPRWLANACFAWCVATNLRGTSGMRTACVGLLLVAASLLLPINYFPNDHAERVDTLGAGAWLWAASLVVTFAISIFGLMRRAAGTTRAFALGPRAGIVAFAVVGVGAFLVMRPYLFPGHARFEVLCRQARVRVEAPVVHARSVFIEDDWFARDGSSVIPEYGSLGEALLVNSDIDFDERRVRGSYHFRDAEGTLQRLTAQPGPGRVVHPGNRSIYVEAITAPTADYVIRGTDLSEPAIDESLGGSRLEVLDRRTGRRVAFAEHYWRGSPREACPTPADGKFSDFRFVLGALGLPETQARYSR